MRLYSKPMTKTTLSEQKILTVLREAIELAGIAGRKVSNRAIVERVYETEPALMAEYQRQWSIDRNALDDRKGTAATDHQ